MDTLLEQRKERRTNLSWPVSVWIPQANRFFNGTSENVSKAGVFINVPITTPVRAGSIIELNFPRTSMLAEHKGQFARIKKGHVVRVDRSDTLEKATIGIGVAFD